MSEKEIKPNSKDVEDNKLIAAIGYVSILFVLPMFLKKNSKFAQFHAKQGLLLFIIEVVCTWLPFLWPVLVLAILAALWGIKSSLEGKYWEIPLIGKYTKKLNI